MKKLLLVAMIAVAGVASAKDNEKVKNDKKTKKVEQKAPFQQCGVTITYYSGGKVTGIKTVYSDQPTLEACQNWQTGVKVALWAQGFILS